MSFGYFLFSVITVSLSMWCEEGVAEGDMTVLSSEAIRNIISTMGFTDTVESYTERTTGEAQAVLEGIKMIFDQVPTRTSFAALFPETDTGPKITIQNVLKVVVITVAGNGAALLEPIKALIDNEGYSNFVIYYVLNYTSNSPRNTANEYKYCQKILAELHSKKYSTDQVRIFRYIPIRHANFGADKDEASMLVREALDDAIYLPNLVPSVHKLPENAISKNGCIIFDGISGTGMKPVDPSNAVFLNVAVAFIKDMARIKLFYDDKVVMVCNDSPSGMRQDGTWMLNWGSAPPLNTYVKYKVDYILSMHWNKPFVNKPELKDTVIILLKYSFQGVSFFDVLALHPALVEPSLDPTIVGLKKDLDFLKKHSNKKAFRMWHDLHSATGLHFFPVN